MNKKRKGWVVPRVYSKIVQLVPIVTVDLVVIHPDGRFLLIWRSSYPKKGRYWFPGGKVDINETPEKAAYRIIDEEIGKRTATIHFVGTNTLFFRKGWLGKRSQAIGLTFLAWIAEGNNISLDEQSKKYEWVEKLPEYLIHYYPYLAKL